MSDSTDYAWSEVIERCQLASDRVDRAGAVLAAERLALRQTLMDAHRLYGVSLAELARALGRSRAEIARLADV